MKLTQHSVPAWWRAVRRRALARGVGDEAQERRYQLARDLWLRPRLMRIALLAAGIFLVFIPLDTVFAPDHVRALAIVRAGSAGALIAAGLMARLRDGSGSLTSITCLMAGIVYAEVFLTRLVLGLESGYDFTAQMMLVQIGVWCLGAITFAVAAAINAVAVTAWLAFELLVTGTPGHAQIECAVLLATLGLVGGFAAFNIEVLLRRNFASKEALTIEKQAYRARAMRDGLTGLWNRRAMEERLAAACATSSGLPRSCAVLMIDLDDFKPVNDRYGHRAGDEVLIAVARRIQGVLRPSDSAGRIGGDEFLVLAEDLPGGSDARGLADRIRQELESPVRVHLRDDGATASVTVGASIGVRSFHDASVAPADLIKNADTDMYRDKIRRRKTDIR